MEKRIRSMKEGKGWSKEREKKIGKENYEDERRKKD